MLPLPLNLSFSSCPLHQHSTQHSQSDPSAQQGQLPLKSQESSPQKSSCPWSPFWHLRMRSPIRSTLSMPSQHEANWALRAMFPPYVLADRAKLSCIREVADYVTCNMSKAIGLYWFLDSCCVGLGIFCSLLWEHSVFSGNVRTPMSQWKESP